VEILDNKSLLLRLRNPEKVAATLNKCKKISDNEVIVNWGIDEVHTLKELNIKVPSPIEGQYSWTGQYKPLTTRK
jgi:hypothetical protein